MNKKAITVGAIALSISTFAAVGGSLAYFTDSEQKNNVFAVGDVDIELTEPQWEQTEQHIIVPGAEIQKDPTVTNVGVNDAYIRVKMTINNFNVIMDSFSDGIQKGVIKGFDNSLWTIESETVSPDTDTCTVILIYNNILKNTDDGVKVFTSLFIPSDLDSELEVIEDINPTVTVSAEAIQSDGFDSARSAFAAFDTQK